MIYYNCVSSSTLIYSRCEWYVIIGQAAVEDGSHSEEDNDISDLSGGGKRQRTMSNEKV